MRDLVQFESCGSGKVRVQPQHVNCELHLVDDALAGTVAARKQFEVFESIVLAIAVYVMHSFMVVKRATEMLLHHIAMFHDAARAAVSRKHGNDDPNITVSFDVFFVQSGFKTVLGVFLLGFNLAFMTAIFLLSVNSASGFSFAIELFVTILASELIALVGVFSPSSIRAIRRTVEWIVSKFFAVCSQVRLHHRKWFVAFFADKFDRHTAKRYVFFEAVSASACETAKFSLIARVAVKLLIAIRATQFDWHGLSPLFGNSEIGTATSQCQVAL